MSIWLLALSIFALILAVVPAWCFLVNVRLYAPPPPVGELTLGPPRISVLIPARNEEATIRGAVASVLESQGVELEVVVLDDHSEDGTGSLVLEMSTWDSRVRLEEAPPLPAGWCGKQHACWVLSRLARYPILVFIDADVRLSPDALARMAAFLTSKGADLASGIPRQETGSILEALIIPLVHFILLGFLPLGRMRRGRDPRFAAGCATVTRVSMASGRIPAAPRAKGARMR